MTITTNFTCDKCQKTQTDDKDFWQIGIWVKGGINGRFGTPTPTYPNFIENKTLHLCTDCLRGLGMHPRKQDFPDQPPYNLEDCLRELIQEEVDNAMENR